MRSTFEMIVSSDVPISVMRRPPPREANEEEELLMSGTNLRSRVERSRAPSSVG
jgi:hypothetical protein